MSPAISKPFVGHRGYPAAYPENTLASVEAALRAGAEYLEVDVQLSRDGQPVLFHDRTLERLCRQSGSIHDYDWSRLQDFRVSYQRQADSQTAGYPIPHLSELIGVLNAWPQVTAFIELKRISLERFGIAAMVDTVLQQLVKAPSQCVIISYAQDALAYVRENTRLPIGVVIDNWAERTQPSIAELEPEYLFCDIDSLPASGSLAFGHSRLVVFECTDPCQAEAVLARGVDLVETFAIGEMLSAYKGKNAAGTSTD